MRKETGFISVANLIIPPPPPHQSSKFEGGLKSLSVDAIL